MVAPSSNFKVSEKVVEFNDIVEQTYYFEQSAYELNKKIEKNKAYLLNNFGKNRRVDVRVDSKTAFTAMRETHTDIEIYREQLRKTLTKEQYGKVVDKTVTITNLSGLISMLKGYGVPPKHFKEFIKSTEEVNMEKLDQLMEIGEISMEHLQGCYKADFKEDVKIRKTP